MTIFIAIAIQYIIGRPAISCTSPLAILFLFTYGMERKFSNNRMMHKYPKYLLSRSFLDCLIAEIEKPMQIPFNMHGIRASGINLHSGLLCV